MYDLLVLADGQGRIDPFFTSLLKLADPDFFLSLDPRLDDVDWDEVIARLGLQPFDVIRFREGMERRDPWVSLFLERPTRAGTRAHVVDVDDQTLTWKKAARFGLPFSDTRAKRGSQGDSEAEAPVRRGASGLTAQTTPRRWAVFGDSNELNVAAKFWSLRALGASPTWLPDSRLARRQAPRMRRGGYLFAPNVPMADVTDAADRWTDGIQVFEPAPPDPVDGLDPPGTYFFSSKIEAISPFGAQLRTSLPSPPVLGEPLRRDLVGVAEYQVLSPDPGDPDGVVLSRDEKSRDLISRGGKNPYRARITRWGFAEVRPVSEADLAVVPAIGYWDAVGAPLAQAGYAVGRSDKGLYQQRALELAAGLRFLVWILRQPESADLLNLFHEYHREGQAPPGYRRAVRYEDLRDRLFVFLRRKRSQIRQPLRNRADNWLSWWTNELLEKQLLVAGYVLPCPTCALREFYRAEEVGQAFVCRRCGDRAPVRTPTTRSFHLNEAFYQLRDHDGEVVTLLLAALRDEAQRSFLYLPEAELTRQGNTREADAVSLLDGELVLAEAKSNNGLSTREVEWYVYVARRAKASKVLFATTSQSRPRCAQLDCDTCAQAGAHHRDYAWSDGTRTRVSQARRALSQDGIEVETLCYQRLIADYQDRYNELDQFQG